MTIGQSSVLDDMDDEQWQGLIRAFDCAKDFRVVGEFATEIMHALRPADDSEEHDTRKSNLQRDRFKYRRDQLLITVQFTSTSEIQNILIWCWAIFERYIHIAFGAPKGEDVVRRMTTMVAPTKFQLEESKKPKPRYVLELRTIRRMIQKADNMDQRLTAVLGIRWTQSTSRNSFPARTLKETVSSAGPWCGNVATATATATDTVSTSTPRAATPVSTDTQVQKGRPQLVARCQQKPTALKRHHVIICTRGNFDSLGYERQCEGGLGGRG
ncbi:hypothetical protein EDB89DRAFT_1901877 [Lactarius sanguifluus]|nr:hypothetical protein EDB89DRAFT_1901877 [Lactarius sanguifluus]